MYYFLLVPVQKPKHGKKEEADEDFIVETVEETESEEEGEEEEEEEQDYSNDDGTNEDEEEVSPPSKPLVEQIRKVKKNVKVIRKKIQPVEKEVEDTQQSVDTDASKRGKKRKMTKTEVSGSDGVDTKKEKKEAAVFNDKNVDYNLYHEAPENVATKKIKISSNVILMCKMIEATGDQKGLTYDYAALTISRKTKNGKAYEFNLPLTIAPNLIKGINLIMQDNKHFFQLK